MEQVQANLPYKAFPTSDGVVERRYCTQSGLLAGPTAPAAPPATTVPMTCPIPATTPTAAACAAAQNTRTVPTQSVVPTDTSALDTE